MTEGVHEAFTVRTGQRILERYGMSETIINTSNNILWPGSFDRLVLLLIDDRVSRLVLCSFSSFHDSR